MISRKIRRGIAVLCVCSLTAALFAGCGGRAKGSGAPGGNTPAESPAASEISEIETSVHSSEKASVWGTVTGRVVDAKTGKMLVNVTYKLVADDAPSTKVTVNSDGSFTFQAKGHYEITFEKLGYEPVTLGYDVKAGETLDYGDIAMSEAVDMSGFILTDEYKFLVKWWLQRIFEDVNKGYQNAAVSKNIFTKDEIPANVWGSNLYLYIASNKLNDGRISNFSGDYGEEWHRISEADVRDLIQEVTGFTDSSYADAVIENLKAGLHQHSEGNVEISTVAYLGDSGYFYFKDITGYASLKDKLYVDGIISEQGGAHRQFEYRATFLVGDPEAPMPWVFESLKVDIDGSGDLNNIEPVSSGSSQSGKGTYTTTDTITMRPGTSLDSGEVMKIPSGSSVTVLDFGAKGFYHVQYNGKTGYALASYMTPASGAEKPAAQSTFTVKNYTCIYGWPRPSNAEEVTSLAPGDKLEYIEDSENGTWFVRFNGYLYGFYDYNQGGY